MFHDKLTKTDCDTSSIVLPSCDNIMCDSSLCGIQCVKLLEIIEWYTNVNCILILTTQNQLFVLYFSLGGGAISWKFSKQIVISWSTMEAEIFALDTAIAEA